MKRYKGNQKIKITNQFRKRVKRHIENNNITVQDFADFCNLCKFTIEKILYEPLGYDIFNIHTIDRVCNQIPPNLYCLFEGVEII